MKKIILFLSISALIFSCQKEEVNQIGAFDSIKIVKDTIVDTCAIEAIQANCDSQINLLQQKVKKLQHTIQQQQKAFEEKSNELSSVVLDEILYADSELQVYKEENDTLNVYTKEQLIQILISIQKQVNQL